MNKMLACEKLQYHVNLMRTTKYNISTHTKPNPSIFYMLKTVSNAHTGASAFNLESDQRDTTLQGTHKPIHFQGVSAPVKFNVRENPYTGLYKSGGIGIIRLSRAVPNDDPFVPGFALKIFIDGKPSVNFHAMYSLDGQKTTHFFEHEFSTSVPEPNSISVIFLAFLFKRALTLISSNRVANERSIPLVESASITSDGSLCKTYVAPKSLIFVPNVKYVPIHGDFRIDIMKSVTAPGVLYTVLDEQRNILGEIELMDEFILSTHADDMMFKHQS
jgi:hypothetical protein